MPAEVKALTRALKLLWARLGPARIYVAVLATVVLALAAVGLAHLFSSGNQTAGAPGTRATGNAVPFATAKSEKVGSTPSTASSIAAPATPSASRPLGGERALAITEATQTKRTGRHGETLVVARIGVAPRPNTEKGEVEIHVFFFDLTDNGEIRPTDAQVTYEWLTPVRDWNDPTPKYLAATYLQPRGSRRSRERLNYGGFMVRVYAGGKLQDERSEPEGLLTALRAGGAQSAPLQHSGTEENAGATPAAVSIPPREKEVVASVTTPSPAASPPIVESRAGNNNATIPVGKPVPGKPGFVSSPFDSKFIIDVRGFPPGTLVNDPNTDRTFRVP